MFQIVHIIDIREMPHVLKYLGETNRSSRVIILGTRWAQVASIKPQPLGPKSKHPVRSLNMRLRGP